ncbi:ABC transporter ATP-binding protein [Marinivivus vitaminiproducens]|uniref:ABC transporter ATP-binding protein n=1 Tax=Marinivivus vitaminiproducens TaxID=3035935 RepID=UPI0027AA1EA5|nr:ABC transporter ATP-binding protein [Geminicoccaceae bacterium SCSIO 64248]
MESLSIDSLAKHYGSFTALQDINLAVERGDFIVMVGPSGCGKSTLLRTIAGLEKVSNGTIRIEGVDVTRKEPGDRGVAMVFQNYALYPHMTVAENMGFGLRMAGRPKAEIARAVQRAAEILRITEQLDKRPRQLSGGQRQRVAIGRAITRSPAVFLFDEPLSNLDASLRTQMRVELNTLHADLDATMVYVTHDQTEAMTMADKIVVLNGGRVEQVGAPLELYNRPANRFVAAFLGSPRMNFCEATVEAAEGQDATVRLGELGTAPVRLAEGHGLAAGESVVAGIRPEHIALADETVPVTAALAGTATTRLAEQLGRETVVHVTSPGLPTIESDSGGGSLTLQVGRQFDLGAGAPVTFRIDPADLYLFRQDGRAVSHPMRRHG